MNPLLKLKNFDQSIWLDFLSRDMLLSDKLQALIDEDGLTGVTSNPAIFRKAMAESEAYDEAIRVSVQKGKDVKGIYETLAIEDVQRAADLFRPIYETSEKRDGLVSLEVSPHLAYDTEATIKEAHRLWNAVDRPNLMIKVPATKEGLPAIHQLIREGINVNVTLLFNLARYREVIEAYLTGLEARAKANEPLNHITSVASFFLSRIDVLVDPILEELRDKGGPQATYAKMLRGHVAIANAKVAYQIYRKVFGSDRFQSLAIKGARSQRLLWGSTSTKNPDYSDVMYVEALIGPATINTMPLKTLEAYRDHGNPQTRLVKGVESAEQMLTNLSRLDIDMKEVGQQLEEEGVQKFIDPYDELMTALEERSKEFK